MAENIYLRSLREQYEALRKSIAGVQTRAADAKRDLTNDELRSVVEMGEKADALFTQIEDLTGIEIRNAKVDQMQAALLNATQTRSADGSLDADGAGDVDGEPVVQVGGATTQARDPGHYRRAGAPFSFIGDHYRANKLGDRDAAQRLVDSHRHLAGQYGLKENEHVRDVLGGGATTFGLGLVPPVWMGNLIAPILHRRLRLGRVVRNVPWPGSPFPWTIPVAGTAALSTVVAEGINSTETDPSYTQLTVTPKTIMGYSEVSRQMLEGSNPAVDSIIWDDLIGNFYDNAELELITALNGQASVNAITVSAGTSSTTDLFNQRSGLLDAIATISDSSAGDADVFVGRTSRWTTYLKFQDTSGRPVILAQRYAPANAIGSGDLAQAFANPIQGTLENLLVVTSPGVAASTGFVLNSQEVIFSYSPPMQFRFEEPAGPALIRVGVWGYEAAITGRRPKAITKISYSGS